MTDKQYARGLVVGKFAPLHRGHMHLIQHAIDACAEVLVISYTKPEFEGHGPAARAAHLRAVFPQVRSLVVDDAWLDDWRRREGLLEPRRLPHNDDPADVHRAFTAWLCTAVCGTTVDAVFTSEDYGDGFAAALSAYFGARAGRRHDVRHVCVDRARVAVPVSGTRIRADLHRHRAFLHPEVYASFVRRVCLLGGESSGKTTLARALARELGTVWAPEVGRELWERQGGGLDYADMRRIAEGQAAREDALLREATRWLICDGSALTTVFYSLDGYGRVDPAVRRLAGQPYAHTFLCAPDFPFVQDGTRRDAAFRARQFRWYARVLEARGIPYMLLEGTVAQRVATVSRVLRDSVAPSYLAEQVADPYVHYCLNAKEDIMNDKKRSDPSRHTNFPAASPESNVNPPGAPQSSHGSATEPVPGVDRGNRQSGAAQAPDNADNAPVTADRGTSRRDG
jgi:NadR type nicotinamide-nucleotide adenylyltransferase